MKGGRKKIEKAGTKTERRIEPWFKKSERSGKYTEPKNEGKRKKVAETRIEVRELEGI